MNRQPMTAATRSGSAPTYARIAQLLKETRTC